MKLREVEVSTPKMGKMTLSLMRLTVEQGEVLFDLPFEHDVHRRHRYVIKEFPVLRWSNGMPWHEANAWFVSQAPNIPLGMLRSTCRAAAASCNFLGTYSVIGRKVTEKSCTESFFDRFSVLNANLTHTHELFSNPPQ
ncbi:hypothetical protein, partial [Pseudomonas lundensis]|uniref:hypothetical protein n=1 Tax=Pseudomonas lundensis TaxID=86185 RepID=UPI001EEEA0BC